MTLYDLQLLAASTLHDSATFLAATTAKFGGAFNFYVDPSLAAADEVLPYVAVHSFQKAEEVGDDSFWIIELVLAVQPSDMATDVGGVMVYPSKGDLEYINDLAVAEVKAAIRCQSPEVYIKNSNSIFTEVGEAQEDIQCITHITVSKIKLM